MPNLPNTFTGQLLANLCLCSFSELYLHRLLLGSFHQCPSIVSIFCHSLSSGHVWRACPCCILLSPKMTYIPPSIIVDLWRNPTQYLSNLQQRQNISKLNSLMVKLNISVGLHWWTALAAVYPLVTPEVLVETFEEGKSITSYVKDGENGKYNKRYLSIIPIPWADQPCSEGCS